jgi:hypothetical protein
VVLNPVSPQAPAKPSGADDDAHVAEPGPLDRRRQGRGRHFTESRSGPGALLALPVGVVGLAVGCLLPWRDALHRGVFDDTFWHRAVGVWMLDHHRVITHDVFSYTVAGHSWISPEWGYDVLLAQSVRTVGPVSFWLLSAGLATLTVLVVGARCRMVGAGWTWTGLLCVETGAAVTILLDDRPQMVSYLFFALLLLVLTGARRRRGWLWVVPLLFVAWANLHGSFLLGLAVLGLEVAAAVVGVRARRVSVPDPLPRGPIVTTFVAAGLATFVNPFGPRVYASAFGVTFNSTVRRLIGEWQSPNFHDPATLVVIVAPVAVTVGYLAFGARPVPAVQLALAAFLLVSTLDAVRFLPYFAIAWCALAAHCPPVAEERLRPSLLVWPMVAVLAVAFLHGPWYPAGKPDPSVPVKAVQYLEKHPGRVFSTYLWNDYLDWIGRPVFVDGRTELYTGNGVLAQYLSIDELTVDPDPILASNHVRYVLWPTHQALSIYLGRDPHWQMAWRSDGAVVFRARPTSSRI